MLAMAKRWPEAAVAYADIVAAEGSNVPRLRLAAAASALEAGRHDPKWRERGIALLAGGPADDPLLAPAREKVAANPNVAGRTLGGLLRSPAEGVGELLLRVAVDLGRERVFAPSLVFARLATFAAPDLPEAWIATADLLARDGRRPLALGAIDRLETFGPAYARIAAARRAGILADDGRYADATRIMAAVAGAPQSGAEEWSALADIERRAGDFAAAAAHFGRAIDLLPADAGPERRAMLLFLRGSSEEQGGDWPAAEKHLRETLALVPDNPIYLNYLGYSLLDRGLKPAESRALIERAFAAAPESGAIIDSMGWSLFVAGDYAGAVALLERARAAEPADPTVADHLGDALWRTGRRIEARYAWTAALDQEPPAKLKDRLLAKRDLGLDLAR
jgi:Flp pilus assembly protein TadD